LAGRFDSVRLSPLSSADLAVILAVKMRLCGEPST